MTTDPPPQPWGPQGPQPGYGPPQPQYGPPPPPYGPPQYGPPRYAQPGYGTPQYGHPGQPLPPPPSPKTSKGAKALLAVVGLVVVGIVVAGIVASANGPAGADPGDCIRVNNVTVRDADVEKIDCASPEAAFKVAVNLDSSADRCPEGDYAEYTSSGGRRSDGFKLCLALNASTGDCFKQEGTVVVGKTTKVTCDSSATQKVRKVVEGTADQNSCERGDTVFVYSQPATTVCVTEA